jgi:hypothetical protein
MKIHFELPSTREKSYAYPKQAQPLDDRGLQTELAPSSIHSFQSHSKRRRTRRRRRMRRRKKKKKEKKKGKIHL